MNEQETKTSPEAERVETESVSNTGTVVKSKKKISPMRYVVAIVIVVVIILGALYLLEKEGRSSTTIFSSIIDEQRANAVVAVVNGKEIINSDLNTSINQFAQAAMAQGIDITNPDSQSEIRSQALDVLINTELLKQSADERGISVSDEEVRERLDTITAEIGGEEVLAERMAELGIGEEKLFQDIRDEIVIQQLLDVIFDEANIEITEEEVLALYDNAGGEESGLPALEEVKEQVEGQIRVSKEQATIDSYLEGLKEGAEIEIVE